MYQHYLPFIGNSVLQHSLPLCLHLSPGRGQGMPLLLLKKEDAAALSSSHLIAPAWDCTGGRGPWALSTGTPFLPPPQTASHGWTSYCPGLFQMPKLKLQQHPSLNINRKDSTLYGQPHWEDSICNSFCQGGYIF